MDKISFEVGSQWPLWRGKTNRMTTQNRKKSSAKKNKNTYDVSTTIKT